MAFDGIGLTWNWDIEGSIMRTRARRSSCTYFMHTVFVLECTQIAINNFKLHASPRGFVLTLGTVMTIIEDF